MPAVFRAARGLTPSSTALKRRRVARAGTGVWTASGARADVNALLAGVTFTPTANFNGNFTVGSHWTVMSTSQAFTAIADQPAVLNGGCEDIMPLVLRADVSDSIISRDFAARIDVAARLRALWAHREHRPEQTPRERQAREIAHPQIAAALERYHRVAASQGVEARHPFFDKRVVEFCLALPRDQKVRDGWSKWIVRRAVGRSSSTRCVGVAADGSGSVGVFWPRSSENRAISSRTNSPRTWPSWPYVDLVKVRALHDRYRRGDLEAPDRSGRPRFFLPGFAKRDRSGMMPARARTAAALPCLPMAG
jgi:hypothetical protein